MFYRRSKWIWTNPLPPVSAYVNVLGPHLRILLRAPGGANGNSVGIVSWKDEIGGVEMPRDAGAPTLVADGSNFRAQPTVRFPTSVGRFMSAAQQNPLLVPGAGIEMFAVIRAVTLAAVGRVFSLYPAANTTITATIGVDTGALRFDFGGNSWTAAYADTTNAHLVTARYDLNTQQSVISVDGVDVFSGAGVPASLLCSRASVGSSGSALDGFVAMCGYVDRAMTTAERADFLRIARQEYGF